ncbi:hypothetical protein [Gordonia sp. FQ]|uniref:hypothetical protein n=1 Tax=Gordonia sp. FQ TaxID=3446634 RepID=UPI003F84A677
MNAPLRGRPREVDLIEAIADSSQVYALAAHIPAKDERTPGPARRYPEALVILYITLAGLVGSHRLAASVLAVPAYWQRLREGAARFGIDLPADPPRRWTCEDARRRYLTAAGADPAQGLFEALRSEFAVGARDLAREHGALDNARRRAVQDPPRGNTIVADGKVVSSMHGEKARARRRERGATVEGALHVQGGDGGTKSHGLKFWHASVRVDDQVNSRLYLDMRYVPATGYGGEAGIGTAALIELISTEPGATTLCYDGALRGVHLHELATAGYLIFSPPHATTAKPHALEQVATCPCGKPHRLITVDGYVAARQISDTGDSLDTRLDVARIFATGRAGATRWYLEVVLPCGNKHRIRINEIGSDGKHRIERVRQSAKVEDDPNAHFNQFYGRREDAESANNVIERTLYGGRAISLTAAGQFLVMLGHALGRNAYAHLLWRRQQDADDGPPIAA